MPDLPTPAEQCTIEGPTESSRLPELKKRNELNLHVSIWHDHIKPDARVMIFKGMFYEIKYTILAKK